MHKILIYIHIIHLLKSSTCFEHYPAHLQEVCVVIVYMQPLVSSLPAGDCPVHRLRKKELCLSWKSTKIISERIAQYLDRNLMVSRPLLKFCDVSRSLCLWRDFKEIQTNRRVSYFYVFQLYMRITSYWVRNRWSTKCYSSWLYLPSSEMELSNSISRLVLPFSLEIIFDWINQRPVTTIRNVKTTSRI